MSEHLSSSGYDPKQYWDARLTRHGGLRGTGHVSFGERYNEWLYRAKDRALTRALAGRALSGSRVLDVGCGNGYFVRWYRSRGAEVVGVDISPSGDVVDDSAFEQALRFIASNVASGGALLITDRLEAASDERVRPHVRMRCLATYERILSACSLELVGRQFLYRWLNRYVSLPMIDSRLGGLYYWLVGGHRTIPPGNLALGVWRRV